MQGKKLDKTSKTARVAKKKVADTTVAKSKQAKAKNQSTKRVTSRKAVTKNKALATKPRHYLAAFLLMAAGILVFLALITSTTSDLQPEASTTLNLLGPAGAYIASILLKLFGLSSFFFSTICILLAIFAFFGRALEARPPELLGQSMLIFASAPLFEMLIQTTVLGYSAGGVLGVFLSSLLLKKLSFAWATSLCAVLSFFGLLLVTNTKFSSFIRLCARIIKICCVAIAKAIAAPFVYLHHSLRQNRLQLAPSLAGVPSQNISPSKPNKVDRERSSRSIIDKAPSELRENPILWIEDPDTNELLGTHKPPVIEEVQNKPEPKKEGKNKTDLEQNTSAEKERLASILQKISKSPRMRKTRRTRSIPLIEPSFEFDSIVSPEQLSKPQVLANWKPRTMHRKSITYSGAPTNTGKHLERAKTLPPTLAICPSCENCEAVTAKAENNDKFLSIQARLKSRLAPHEAQDSSEDRTKPGNVAAELARHMLQPKLNLTPAESCQVGESDDSLPLKTTEAVQSSQESTRVESIQNIDADAILENNYKSRAFTRHKTLLPQENTDEKVTPIPVSRNNSVPSIESITRAASAEVRAANAKAKAESIVSKAVSTEIPQSPKSNTPVAGFVVAQAKQNASEEELLAAENERLQKQQNEKLAFQKPPLSLLKYNPNAERGFDNEVLQSIAEKIEEKLAEFRVKGKVVEICPGPVVTRFEFLPDPGTRVNSISNLSDDLKMALEVTSIRILAPIPGKNVVGIEIPNEKRNTIYIKEILASKLFNEAQSVLTLALGKDIEGDTVVSDLAKMPHLLIAGSTGSGKSVGINTMLCSLLYNATPEEVRLILVDPKCLELSIYNGIPHLLLPPITEPEKSVRALEWACDEMDARYLKLADLGVRNIKNYNEKLKNPDERLRDKLKMRDENDELIHQFMPYIVIVVDEFADLMMTAGKDIERAIARLAQKARAAGIHLVLATQRPSTDVITGVIKANFPTRLAFRVFSYVDSRTILNTKGAEDLLGYGDSLFTIPNSGMLQRVHGAFISDEEVQAIADFLCAQGEPQYNEDIIRDKESNDDSNDDAADERLDSLFDDAIAIVANAGQASASLLQRRMSIGYNRAARLIEQLERQGIVGPANGQKAREVYVDANEY
ncbi:MAG: DNA translocase FtsK 4TM domain-containing protein [Bradymonadales bacterium]